MKLSRKSRRLLLPVIFLMALVMLTPLAQAKTYSESTRSWPPTAPGCYAYLVVDTTTDTVEVRWEGPTWIYSPVPATHIKLWSWWTFTDNKGFEKRNSGTGISASGSESFFYSNSGTWVHLKVHWAYWFLYWGADTTAKIDIYITSNPNDPWRWFR